MDTSFQGIIQRHNIEMQTAFSTVVDAIVKHAKVDIWCLRITTVTEDSFNISLEGSVTTPTRAIKATIAPMTLDLCDSQERLFAQLPLEKIDVANGKGIITINNQQVDILDRNVLLRWIKSVMKAGRSNRNGIRDALILLRKGRTTLKALGLGPRPIVLEKEVQFPGMNGPEVSIASMSRGFLAGFGMSPSTGTILLSDESMSPDSGDIHPEFDLAALTNPNPSLTPSPSTGSITPDNGIPSSSTSATLAAIGSKMGITLHVTNPSPLEISFGIVSFEIRTSSPRVSPTSILLAELKGRLTLRRNRFEVKFQGTVNTGMVAKLADVMRKNQYTADEVRLVGKRCVGAGWCDATIKGIDVPLKNVHRLFRALDLEGYESDEEEDDGEDEEPLRRADGVLSRWAQRLSLR
ncbi:hypothetical protein F5Y16DRAFT_424245 [Xylariaceae sp. FL0255]|nr:hypothetical protein F5Y16DRAFT_424245 [Xylariaceae sp. FL0255]